MSPRGVRLDRTGDSREVGSRLACGSSSGYWTPLNFCALPVFGLVPSCTLRATRGFSPSAPPPRLCAHEQGKGGEETLSGGSASLCEQGMVNEVRAAAQPYGLQSH